IFNGGDKPTAILIGEGEWGDKLNDIHAVKDVVADAHRFPGAAWEFGKTLASQAIRQKTAKK
ncbi:MAG: hypothetical protein ACKPAE_14075, partial [Microcystis panniformis]